MTFFHSRRNKSSSLHSPPISPLDRHWSSVGSHQHNRLPSQALSAAAVRHQLLSGAARWPTTTAAASRTGGAGSSCFFFFKRPVLLLSRHRQVVRPSGPGFPPPLRPGCCWLLLRRCAHIAAAISSSIITIPTLAIYQLPLRCCCPTLQQHNTSLIYFRCWVREHQPGPSGSSILPASGQLGVAPLSCCRLQLIAAASAPPLFPLSTTTTTPLRYHRIILAICCCCY